MYSIFSINHFPSTFWRYFIMHGFQNVFSPIKTYILIPFSTGFLKVSLYYRTAPAYCSHFWLRLMAGMLMASPAENRCWIATQHPRESPGNLISSHLQWFLAALQRQLFPPKVFPLWLQQGFRNRRNGGNKAFTTDMECWNNWM